MARRLLFASIHSCLDPASGAALAMRELLELMASARVGLPGADMRWCWIIRMRLRSRMCWPRSSVRLHGLGRR